MPDFIENIVDFMKEKPLVAAGAVAGAAVIFILARRGGGAASDTGEAKTKPGYGVNGSPLYDQSVGNVPVIYNYTPTMPAPGDQSNPGTALVSLKRDGAFINVTGGPPGICPPGYVSVQQPGQPPRCSLANDENKKPGQRTSYVPSMGQSPYVA